jgi:hypothetical protein
VTFWVAFVLFSSRSDGVTVKFPCKLANQSSDRTLSSLSPRPETQRSAKAGYVWNVAGMRYDTLSMVMISLATETQQLQYFQNVLVK